MDERYQYILTSEDTELPIKELLKRRMAISSRLLRKLKAGDKVYLDGEKIRLYEKGREGSKITIKFPEEKSDFPPQAIPVDVLYEDRDLLVINKQPGIVVHPTKGHPCNTIANGIMNHMMDREESYKIRFINRLDMFTSGVLLVGKNSYSQDDFTRQAFAGEVVKSYILVVNGTVDGDRGTIDLPIAKLDENDIKRAVISGGYNSITHYEVIERYSIGYTLLRAVLETGRTHQIRVHFSHLGHPVVGDNLYGGSSELIARQALHAEKLDFRHPATGKNLSIRAPMPPDMEDLLSQININR